MTIYYKGLITLKKKIKIETIPFQTSNVDKNSKMYLNGKHSKRLSQEDIECLYENIYNKYKGASYNLSQIADILFKVNPIKFKSSMNIIYEELVDEKGQRYAKEKDNSLIFPLFSHDDLEDWIFNLNKCWSSWGYHYFKGKFSTDFKLRDNFALCDCYCIADGVANHNEIKKYQKTHHDYSVLEEFFYMNVFDDSRINNNSQQTINSLSTSINCDNSFGSTINSIKQNSTPSNKSNNSIQVVESLETIKNFLISLPDDKKSLLHDIIQNNLLNYNLGELIQMSKMSNEDLLNTLLEQSNQKNVGSSKKVSLAKKTIEEDESRQIVKKL